MQIREDDLTGEKIADLLREYLEHMYEITPPQSVYALDLEALRSSDITFFSAWEAEELLGCGALKQLDWRTGEIKSMRTAKAHRRRGIASKILEHIIKESQRRGYEYLNLQTGFLPAFAPAQALYTKYGFQYRGSFGDYNNDPNSVFMTKKL
ncbi:GNAT family N-acetyltransferase [Nostoc sp. MS1]|uniref:GNAT family N-acetyltransferase n=1 Tax=Nostoc sp. MS1 TaxID=2764711 RepID=UPI001CC68F68|nr:GNAT family N-acetyltransferase [Nostoc sp. MS1]